MPPLEVWEKVLIDPEAIAGDVHSFIPCTDCHGGQDVADMDAAHEGVVRDPSIDAEATCGNCHTDIAPYQHSSLHYNLEGYDTVLHQRSTPENHDLIELGESYHCNDCHATCGQCHVSQPTSVGGGLIEGHAFNAVPSMNRQCTACHGSRVKNEYTGVLEGASPDVHLVRARMVCTDCHTGGDMHGTDYIDDPDGMPNHRYDGEQSPSCESCHEDQIGIGSGNAYHEAHGTEILSCQTCHSIEYTNCYTCHLNQSERGTPYFIVEEEGHDFLIGRNPRRSQERPYRFVPVRHVPTHPGLFDLYGKDILPNFDNLPTWTYATPHNIQRNTPQTESCESCHGNDEYFLTVDKVAPETLQANLPVIVPEAPPPPESYDFIPRLDEVPDATSDEPSGDPLDAAPSGDPLDAAPSTDPLDAAPSGDPLDAAPSGDPLDAAPSGDPLDAAPSTDPLDAAPSGDPLDAAPSTDPLDAAPSGDPLDAAPQPTATPDPLDG